METSSITCTLFEDWQARRRRLLDRPGTGSAAYSEVQLHILDFLLARYADSPEASQPARFPAPTDVWFNHRAIVIHHHLSEAPTEVVRSDRDAHARVSSILKRMSAEVGRAVRPATMGTVPPPPPLTRGQVSAREEIARIIEPGFTADQNIEHVLSRRFLIRRRKEMELLCERLRDTNKEDLDAARSLALCGNRSASGYALLAWRERIAVGVDDQVTQVLRAILALSPPHEQIADRI